jgi:hypothetical protein
MSPFRFLLVTTMLAAACRSAEAPKPTTPPPDPQTTVLRTYVIPSGQQKVVERLLRGNSYPISVVSDKGAQTQFVHLNPQFTGDGYFILSAPIGIHEGVAQLLEELKSRPPTTGPTSIETTYWLVVGYPSAKTEIPSSLDAIAPALKGISDLGTIKFEPYETLQVTALDGEEAKAIANRAQVRQTVSADKDSFDLRVQLEMRNTTSVPVGTIETSVRVKSGQFAVLGEAGFKPPGAQGAPLEDPRATLFYVLRTRPSP